LCMLSQLNQVHFSHHLIGYWVVDDIKESPKKKIEFTVKVQRDLLFSFRQYFKSYGKIFYCMSEGTHTDDIDIECCILRKCFLIDSPG